jgi:DNA-binding transcriptional LysR family regulator
MRAFLAVAEELNFSRAAARLHLAQPALSNQIKQLETGLGVRLFERNTRSVRLTAAGEAFREPCKKALRYAAEAETAAHEADEGLLGRVRIGFSGSFTSPVVARLTREVRRELPGVRMEILPSANSQQVIDGLVEGDLDLGLYAASFGHRTVAQHVIGETALDVLVGPDHPWAGRERVHISELREQPLVLSSRSSGLVLRDAAIQACRHGGFEPLVAQESGDSYTVLTLVSAGAGITLVPEGTTEIQPRGVHRLRLDGTHETITSALGWCRQGRRSTVDRVLEIAFRLLPAVHAADRDSSDIAMDHSDIDISVLLPPSR